MSERRVVVTGLGATTPLGGTIAETWDGLLAGRSGAKPLPEEWLERYELPVHFACTIAQKPEEVLTKVEVRRMDPSAQYAVIASRAAMEDAGSPEIDPLRLGVAIGTGIGGVWTLLDQWDILKEKGVRRVFPLAVPMLMPNTSAGNVSLQLGARGIAAAPDLAARALHAVDQLPVDVADFSCKAALAEIVIVGCWRLVIGQVEDADIDRGHHHLEPAELDRDFQCRSRTDQRRRRQIDLQRTGVLVDAEPF